MKYTCLLIFTALFFSCSDQFLKHDLEFEKQGPCTEIAIPVKIISNINGQRYEFFTCTDADFSGKEYSVERMGDTIHVNFARVRKEQALFKMILDLDAKPAYNHIIIDGQQLR